MTQMSKILTPLNLPKAPLKLKKSIGDEIFVWEPIRKKWLLLTPEEWVRCHVIYFLNSRYDVPLSFMKTEFAFEINKKIQRCDILTYSKKMNPQILVECKAPEVKVDDKVADQICAYNYKVGAQYLFLTNGLDHLFYEISGTSEWRPVEGLPSWIN